MIQLAYKSWGDAVPIEMPKLYFTCRQEDFDRCFEPICRDIFARKRCAIYYTPDMRAELSPEERLEALSEMNLFVIPVTLQLLTSPNRAMDADLPFALAHHIPVLPIMMEPGLSELYKREDRFGSLHYLSPSPSSNSGLSYQEKLGRYLHSVLGSSELREAAEKAFDARFFLSYRRHDRLKAMEFMRLVHRIPEFRDVAIWYDDFLTPGDDYREALRQKIQSCDLFALLVTPNLLNDPNNYVLKAELPDARQYAKPVLGAEMSPADPEASRELLQGVNRQVDPRDQAALKDGVLTLLPDTVLGEQLDSPYRQFLMGAAYLLGIDVELDRDRALSLLSAAAEADELNAQRLLRDMYSYGSGVPLDYRKALSWARRYAESCRVQLGEEHPESFSASFALADCCDHAGLHREELERWEALLAQTEQAGKGESEQAQLIRTNIAACRESLGDYEQALELSRRMYERFCAAEGRDGPHAIAALGNIADILYDLREHDQAIQLGRETCERADRIYGKDHPLAMYFRNNLGCFLVDRGELEEAETLLEELRQQRERILGPEHPETLDTLHNLAWLKREQRDYDGALALERQVYEQRKRILGEEHPSTQRSLHSLVKTCGLARDGRQVMNELLQPLQETCEKLRREEGDTDPRTLQSVSLLSGALRSAGRHEEALALATEIYESCRKTLGEKDPAVLKLLDALGDSQFRAGEYKAATRSKEQYAALCRELYGEKHPKTLKALRQLAAAYSHLGEAQKAFDMDRAVYPLFVEVFGEDDPETLAALQNLADGYLETGDAARAEAFCRMAYEKRCRVLGDTDPDTVFSLSHLSIALARALRFPEAAELGGRAYALQARLLGRRHPHSLLTLCTLADSHLKLLQYSKALAEGSYAHRVACSLYPPDHPLALHALHVVADAYRKLGDAGKALELDMQIHALFREKYPPTAGPVISSLKSLTSDALRLRNAELAQRFSQEAYELECAKNGERHPDTLFTHFMVAMSRSLSGERDASLELLDRCSRELAENLGERHVLALSARYNTALCLWRDLKDPETALARAEDAYARCREALGENYPLTQQAWELLQELRIALANRRAGPESAMKAVYAVKAQRHYERLLTGKDGRRTAEEARDAYAPGADLSRGYAVQETGRGFLGLGGRRGILFTEDALYSDRLPKEGLPYGNISGVNLEDCLLRIRMKNGTEYSLDLGASGPDAAAVLQAACDARRV